MLLDIAYRTLVYDRGKLIAGLVGVIFSVVLVNIQGGLFFGLIGKASLLIDRGNADIWVGHRGMHNVDLPSDIPERWIYRVQTIPGVAEARPIRIGFAYMSLPNGGHENTAIVGVSPDSDLGRVYDIAEGPQDALSRSDGVIVDACDALKLQDPTIGSFREIGGKRALIAGKSHGILSFLITPYVFTTYERSINFFGGDPEMASYFLVRLEPTADADSVCAEIQRRLKDASAMPSEQFASESVNFWMTRTGLGLSFGAATAMGLLVGLVMVTQTLYAMVLDRINEFATLKALGATERELLILLGLQSSFVSAAGIGIGFCVSFALTVLFSSPQAEIKFSLSIYAISGLLVFAVCLIASAIPYLRVRRVDPHIILQA